MLLNDDSASNKPFDTSVVTDSKFTAITFPSDVPSRRNSISQSNKIHHQQNLDTVLNSLKSNNNLDADDSLLESNNFFEPRNYNLQASDKENWIFFSIIISVVIALSILFCFLVYKFFPKYE